MKHIRTALIFGLIAATVAFSGCSTKSKTSEGDKSTTSSTSIVSEYANSPYYTESVKKLKDVAKLDDKQADDAFGAFTKCGIVTDSINYVFTTTVQNQFTVWFKLEQYNVTFNADKVVEKIADGNGNTIYENGAVVTEAVPETAAATTEDAQQQTTEGVSREYQNALKSAESYLKYSAFSKEGLYDQLLFEKFTEEAAKYAVDNVNADWKEEAAKCAESYLKNSAFSKEELYEQLIFEKFTEEEAQYGVDKVY